MKVMTIVGTRPEIIKLSAVIPELDKFTEHILVHTGQNYDYELNEIFFDGMGIRKPDIFMQAAGENASETIGNVIINGRAPNTFCTCAVTFKKSAPIRSSLFTKIKRATLESFA